jgi:hypothetical protein
MTAMEVYGRHKPFEISSTAVDQNDNEKDRVEVGDDRCCTNNSAPHQTHGPVGDIILSTKNIGKQRENDERPGKRLAGLREYAHQPLIKRRLLIIALVSSSRCYKETNHP